VCVLVAFVATATAEPAAATDRARTTAVAAEQKLGQLATKRGQLSARWAEELRAVDRLKQQRASWSRDRELREQLGVAKATADELERVTRDEAAAQTALATARRALIAAIDAELAAGTTDERAAALAAERAKLAPQVAPAPKKIVIPDCDDSLGDPDELELCVKALRQSETDLEKQAQTLDAQAKQLAKQAELRGQHDRAVDVGTRDDDQPHRTVQPSSGDHAGLASNPSTQGGGSGSGSGGGGGGGGDHIPASGVNPDEVSVVLGDVVDRGTIDGYARAQRSGDPKQRAEASAKAAAAVKARLDKVKVQRAAIEKRARALRRLPRVDRTEVKQLAFEREVHRVAGDVAPRREPQLERPRA
jgi:hypothetical protein